MVVLTDKLNALLALQLCLPTIADEDEQDSLIWAVFRAVTGQQPDEKETHDDTRTRRKDNGRSRGTAGRERRA